MKLPYRSGWLGRTAGGHCRWLARMAAACLALLLAPPAATHAQAVLRKDLKRDFGAVGDGRTNDQPAFERAAAFFNQRALTPAGTGRAELRIPAGLYLMGRQDADFKGPDVLRLVGCRNLAIVGADSATTEIRYVDGLRFGAFDPATGQAYESPKAFFTTWSYGALGGTCIALESCEGVEVANLNLNGNSPHLRLGGHWGDTGIQLSFDGIFVHDSRRIVLRRLAVHHFGRDGVQVLNRLAKSLDDPAREGIVLERSTYDYNGRQGLSITGVNGLRAVECSFSHTARVPNLATGHVLFSNPAAGIDMEPEGGYVANVEVLRCRLVDNGGQALVSDRPPGVHPPTTRNIRLTDCTFWGTTNWSAWVTQPGFVFTGCRFYGAFVHGCDAGSEAEATQFRSCTFEDKPYAGRAAMGPFVLLSYQHARRLRFVDCRFIASHGYLLYAAPLGSTPAEGFEFQHCAFSLRYGSAPRGHTNRLSGATFTGETVIDNGPGPGPAGAARTDFLLGDLQVPGHLALQARRACYRVQGALAVGRPNTPAPASQLTVGGESALVLGAAAPADTAALYIGPGARLLVKKGGALELLARARITIAGRLEVEDGAYFFRDARARVQLVGQGALRLAPGALAARHPTLGSPD